VGQFQKCPGGPQLCQNRLPAQPQIAVEKPEKVEKATATGPEEWRVVGKNNEPERSLLWALP
jgi:hypothetical protein